MPFPWFYDGFLSFFLSCSFDACTLALLGLAFVRYTVINGDFDPAYPRSHLDTRSNSFPTCTWICFYDIRGLASESTSLDFLAPGAPLKRNTLKWLP